ncbi:uncharacterized protein LOC133174101 [Saccostrea echinata]|uniref:uncharacterized protein LOC133174101 n=1 Tax=Saccostrea echinata TaxID=191078 RepID=UPI002A82B6FC|nr:uncharacterized protein LOC133174101 [Saccostrea echinata]
MSQEELNEAKKAVFVSSIYEDITPENSPPRPSTEYDPISEYEDWPSIGSDLENELLNSSNNAEVNAFLEDILDGSEEVHSNLNEPSNSENSVSIADSMPIDRSSTTVTETIILKMTKKTIYHSDGNSEIVRDTEISHSETVNPDEVDLVKFATDILNEVPEHFRNRKVRIVELNE